jgi:hypothetical protein
VELWRAINEIRDKELRQRMRFAFTAILARASKRYQWSAQRPLNAQNQTYYIAPVYYEWNVFELFDRKIEAGIRATAELFETPSIFDVEQIRDVTYHIASAEKLKHLEHKSVDYVFTDPPFGSNICDSDMNLFHEAWLGEVTEHASEAVVHTTGKRKNQIDRVRALLVELEWTESDAWIRLWELPETFRGTLMEETPTFASMPSEEVAELIRELERILAEE